MYACTGVLSAVLQEQLPLSQELWIPLKQLRGRSLESVALVWNREQLDELQSHLELLLVGELSSGIFELARTAHHP